MFSIEKIFIFPSLVTYSVVQGIVLVCHGVTKIVLELPGVVAM